MNYIHTLYLVWSRRVILYPCVKNSKCSLRIIFVIATPEVASGICSGKYMFFFPRWYQFFFSYVKELEKNEQMIFTVRVSEFFQNTCLPFFAWLHFRTDHFPIQDTILPNRSIFQLQCFYNLDPSVFSVFWYSDNAKEYRKAEETLGSRLFFSDNHYFIADKIKYQFKWNILNLSSFFAVSLYG